MSTIELRMARIANHEVMSQIDSVCDENGYIYADNAKLKHFRYHINLLLNKVRRGDLFEIPSAMYYLDLFLEFIQMDSDIDLRDKEFSKLQHKSAVIYMYIYDTEICL